MMIKKVFYILLMSIISLPVFSKEYTLQDVEKVSNDKEVVINSFSSRTKKKVLKKYPDEMFKTQLGQIFYQSLLQFLNTSKMRCELNLIDIFKSSLESQNIPVSEDLLEEYFIVLRSSHFIDDMMYDFLSGISADSYELKEIDKVNYKLSKRLERSWTRPSSSSDRRKVYDYKKLIAVNNTAELFSNFEQWPDEEQLCLYQEMNFIKTDMKDHRNEGEKIKKKRKLQILELLNRDAVLKGVISANTYKKIEYLRTKSFSKDRYLRLEDYLNVVFKAKNNLKPNLYSYESKNIEKEYNFSSERLKRFSKLTRRKDLYEKYNETQIILLAQVLVKASRRMGVDPDVVSSQPIITQTFAYTNQYGEVENYVEEIVLDPQSQYNLARKRMRKDILDLHTMDIFSGVKIHYDEVVMAAFETGYLSIEDIEYAIKYDDLWNPEKSRFERITGFIFKVSGYATFFIPPPYNVTASLGLAILQGVVDKRNVKGEDNENVSTFID